jgi:hypothetical protein
MEDHPSAREEDPMSQLSTRSPISPLRQRMLEDMAFTIAAVPANFSAASKRTLEQQ